MSVPGASSPSDPMPAPRLDQTDVTPVEPPRTIIQAVRLMYAGAVLSALSLINAIFDKSRLHDSFVKANVKQAAEYAKNHGKAKPLDAATLDSAITQAWVLGMISGAITVALWLIMARTNGKGNGAARIVATALCVLNVLLTVANLAGGFSIIGLAVDVVMLVISIGATYLLWRPDSSAFFSSVRARRIR